MNWKDCLAEGNAVKITPNKKRADFLVKRAESTLKVLGNIKLDETNAPIFFTNYYDALLEILHAMMYTDGYKVKNHYCLGYYLQDILQDRESFSVFDRSRLLRNSIIYYGELFDKAVLLDAIRQIKETFAVLRRKIR